MELSKGSRLQAGKRIEIIRAARSYRNLVRAGFFSEPPLVLAVESDHKQMAFQRARLAGRIENAPPGFIHGGDTGDLPVSARDLSNLPAIGRIQVKMAIAGALASPEEVLAVVDEPHIAAEVEPIGVRLFEDRGCLAGFSIDSYGLQMILKPIHAH